MSDLSVNDWLMDLRLNATRLEDIVEEVEKHVADGNLDGAALVLATQTGKVGRFQESWSGLRKKLEEEGASSERALED